MTCWISLRAHVSATALATSSPCLNFTGRRPSTSVPARSTRPSIPFSELEKAADSEAIRAVAMAHEGELLAFAGQPVRAEELARIVLDSSAAKPRSRAAAYGAIVPALAMRGLVAEARTEADEAYALFAEPSPLMWEMAGVVAGQFIASLLDPQQARNDQFAPTDSADFDPLTGIWRCLHGRELLARGDISRAIQLLTDGIELLAEDDPGRFLPWATGTLGAAVRDGRPDAGCRTVDHGTRSVHPGQRIRLRSRRGIGTSLEPSRAGGFGRSQNSAPADLRRARRERIVRGRSGVTLRGGAARGERQRDRCTGTVVTSPGLLRGGSRQTAEPQ